MLSRAAQAASNVAKDGEEAPGDSAGGPSSSPYAGMSADASLSGVGDGSVEAVAEKQPASAEAAASAPVATQLQDAMAEAAARAAVRPELPPGDPSIAASRAVHPANVPVAAADSGGGYMADAHNSVRLLGESVPFNMAGGQSAGIAGYDPQCIGGDTRSTPRTPMQPGLREDSDREGQPPLIIAADATLIEGLRALLVHHLKRSVASNVISLSASQAELLEHHLTRLASYAQKIVHTLAFATRFLSKQAEGAADSAPSDAHPFAGQPGGMPQNPSAQRPGEQRGPIVQQPPQQQEPRPTRKALKLSDDEILSIYRSAQVEAAIEADWRGIEGPAQGSGSNRTPGASPATPGMHESPGGDREYLKMLSRALQEPGSSPQALTSEMLDPSSGVVCCHPARSGLMLDAVAGSSPPLAQGDLSRVNSGSHRNGESGR